MPLDAITILQDIDAINESVDLECKLAQGADGKGEVPRDFWNTYSAMANTQGGTVILGVRETAGQFEVVGLTNPQKVRADLFNNLNNRAKVSANVITDADVSTAQIEGKVVLVIRIPQASRKKKPVYLNGQPLHGTYRRLNDGDRLCDEDTVRRMLAEQTEDERDGRVLPSFGMEDIDPESLRIYRQMLKDEKPSHPYLEKDDFNFLACLRAWRRDRETNEEGLTIAGLLMFGRWESIQEAMPSYFVDYQERPEAKAELRWVDRLVPDGSWTGNLFEFYRRVYRKLIVDLKIPFSVKDGQRQEDTPVHVALREALVNTLVHADYSGRISVLVVKRPDMFGFRNPGGLRLPLEQVIKGGESDCRNRILHQMFLLIGLGERSGSGIPKIFSGWKSQHWRPPALIVKSEPEQTLLTLNMLDLLPSAILDKLRQRFGEAFESLNHAERLALATAAIERVVSHNRLQEVSGGHPHDLSLSLAKLVREGFLVSDGRSRGMVYHLPGESLPTPEQVFLGTSFSDSPESASASFDTSSEDSSASSEDSSASSEDSSASSEDSSASSEDSEGRAGDRDTFGRLISSHIDAPIIDNLELLEPSYRSSLETLAAEPRAKTRLDAGRMEAVIRNLCMDQYLTLSALAQLLKRNPDSLRQQYLSVMAREGKIVLAFPTKPTHEKQAYRAAS